MSETCFVLTSVQCVCVCVFMETGGRQHLFRRFVLRGRAATGMNLKRFAKWDSVNGFHGYECKKGSEVLFFVLESTLLRLVVVKFSKQ